MSIEKWKLLESSYTLGKLMGDSIAGSIDFMGPISRPLLVSESGRHMTCGMFLTKHACHVGAVGVLRYKVCQDRIIKMIVTWGAVECKNVLQWIEWSLVR